MSKAQQFGLKVIGLGLFSGAVIAFLLFAFSCIGANTSIEEVVASIAIGGIVVLLSTIPYVLTTVAKIAMIKYYSKRA